MFARKSSQAIAATAVLAVNALSVHGLAALTAPQDISVAVAPAHAAAPTSNLYAEVTSLFQQKQELLQRSISIEFVDAHKNVISSHTIRIGDIPSLITATPSAFGVDIVVDQQKLLQQIDEWIANETFFDQPVVGVVKQGDLHAKVLKEPTHGYTVDTTRFAQALTMALEHEQSRIRVKLTEYKPTVAAISANGTMSTLTHLSTGRSNFEGSIGGRIANVERALNVYLNGIIIEPGETFSFNKQFVNSHGWSSAYVIVNGSELALENGGGICQSSTTLFRAAALAGLPITAQSNHSLYVDYYEQYGVGMDATIYPGKQDFRFVNDTQAPIVLLARTEGTDAYVDLYGVPDGRTVAMNGPLFAGDDDTLKKNDIAWDRTVTHADGTTTKDRFVSRYTAIPKDLAAKYEGLSGLEVLTTAVK